MADNPRPADNPVQGDTAPENSRTALALEATDVRALPPERTATPAASDYLTFNRVIPGEPPSRTDFRAALTEYTSLTPTLGPEGAFRATDPKFDRAEQRSERELAGSLDQTARNLTRRLGTPVSAEDVAASSRTVNESVRNVTNLLPPNEAQAQQQLRDLRRHFALKPEQRERDTSVQYVSPLLYGAYKQMHEARNSPIYRAYQSNVAPFEANRLGILNAYSTILGNAGQSERANQMRDKIDRMLTRF